jgi:hypothetical protein
MITSKDKLQCVVRELGYRSRVYDHLVVSGKMTARQRAREIELMAAIVEDYRGAVAAEEPEFAMFVETRRTVNERR